MFYLGIDYLEKVSIREALFPINMACYKVLDVTSVVRLYPNYWLSRHVNSSIIWFYNGFSSTPCFENSFNIRMETIF